MQLPKERQAAGQRLGGDKRYCGRRASGGRQEAREGTGEKEGKPLKSEEAGSQ